MSKVKQGVRAALRRAVEGGRRGAPLAGAGRMQREGGGARPWPWCGEGAGREREVAGERGEGRGVKK